MKKVLIAILAKQKAGVLPYYLKCLDSLDYPKSDIVIYVRTNNNTDNTKQILEEWRDKVQHEYNKFIFEGDDVPERVQDYEPHDWNPLRFSVLGAIRQRSMELTLANGCDYYFVADVDNFITPYTLKELVSVDLPIVAPMLVTTGLYSNYHSSVDSRGYFQSSPLYQDILFKNVKGLIDIPVVHCTYLVKNTYIQQLKYLDGTDRHEYVIFSDSARSAGIPQYLDNRYFYGCLTFNETAEDVPQNIFEHKKPFSG
jgi:hypothetical protein